MKHEFAVIHEIEGIQVLIYKENSDEEGLKVLVKFWSSQMNGNVTVGFGYDDVETWNAAFEKMKDLDQTGSSLTQIVKGLTA